MPAANDPTKALRKVAAALPEVVEGTACSQTSYKVGKKAFLYVGPGTKGIGYKAMFKLDASMGEAEDLAKSQPERYEVGVGNWVTTRFTAEDALPKGVWSRWLEESYAGAAKSGGVKRKSARRKLALWVVLQGLLLPSVVCAAELSFSSFLGGSGSDSGHAIALTPEAGLVIVGETESGDFPTFRAVQSEKKGASYSMFVVKLDAAGRRIEFATYLGGSGWDRPNAVTVDSGGNIYVAGVTSSRDFPLVGAIGTLPLAESGVDNGFLIKLSPDGQEILFSTLLAGTGDDNIMDLAFERNGRVFVSGWTRSTDFLDLTPIPSEPQTGSAFVASIDTKRSRVVSAALLGASEDEWGSHLAWDARRRVLWLAGETGSSDFPSRRPLRMTSGPAARSGSHAGFLARYVVSADSMRLKSASVLPGPVRGLAVDRMGRPHLTFTNGRLTESGRHNSLEGWEDMVDRCAYSFYFRVQASGRELQNVRCLPIVTSELAVDRSGRVVIAGESRAGLVIADPVQPESELGVGDLYVAVLEKRAARVLFGTYFGGERNGEYVGQYPYSGGLSISKSGRRIFLTGWTRSIDFPLVAPVQPVKPGPNGRADAFVAELRPYR